MLLLASFPSPSDGVLHVGGLTVHMYGLMLLLGIAACVWLTGYRWTRRNGGEWDLVLRAAVWGVAWGIVGARLYHDATSWDDPAIHEHWWGFLAVWKGGLGIWGGIALGTVAGVIVVRRAGASARAMMDAVAPGLLVAQAIGRWGNWWNQELFGGPTSLPWGLEIDEAHRPDGYAADPTFHPTFLYESLWNLGGAGLLLWLGARVRIRPPALFALYVAWYTFGRTFEELLRIDPSHHLLGMRLNFWVSIAVFLAASGFAVWWQLLRPAERRPQAPLPSTP